MKAEVEELHFGKSAALRRNSVDIWENSGSTKGRRVSYAQPEVATPHLHTIDEVYNMESVATAMGVQKQTKKLLLSPRSKAAFEASGVVPSEIQKRSVASFKELGLDEECKKMRHQEYNRKRDEGFRLASGSRNQAISDVKEGRVSDADAIMRAKFEEQTKKSLKREALLTQKNRDKQLKEIEAVVEFEVRTSQILKDGELAEERNRQRAKVEAEKRKRRNNEQEQRKHMSETREMLKREMEAKITDDAAKAIFEEDIEAARAAELAETAHRKKVRQRGDELTAKQKEFDLKKATFIKDQRDAANKKDREMEERSEERNMQQAAQNAERKQAGKKKQIANQKRVGAALEKLDELDRQMRAAAKAKDGRAAQQRAIRKAKDAMKQKAKESENGLKQHLRDGVKIAQEEQLEDEIRQSNEKMETSDLRVQQIAEDLSYKRMLNVEKKHLVAESKKATVRMYRRVEENTRKKIEHDHALADKRYEMMKENQRKLIQKRKDLRKAMSIRKDKITDAMYYIKVTNSFASAKDIFLNAAGFGASELPGHQGAMAIMQGVEGGDGGEHASPEGREGGGQMAMAHSLPALASSPIKRRTMTETARYPGNWSSITLPVRTGIPDGYTSPYSKPVLGYKNGKKVAQKRSRRPHTRA
jgi:hypothetical protein